MSQKYTVGVRGVAVGGREGLHNEVEMGVSLACTAARHCIRPLAITVHAPNSVGGGVTAVSENPGKPCCGVGVT